MVHGGPNELLSHSATKPAPTSIPEGQQVERSKGGGASVNKSPVREGQVSLWEYMNGKMSSQRRVLGGGELGRPSCPPFPISF